MGSKYTVEVWLPIPGDRTTTEGTRYYWQPVHGGEWLIPALIAAFKARKSTGCVRLELR